MMWDLPISVEIDGRDYAIRDRCDYRVALDVISAVNDEELTDRQKMECALFIFYEDLDGCTDLNIAIEKMFEIINYGASDSSQQNDSRPKLMDWEHDFKQLAPPISRTLGYDVRTPGAYTHWWTFLGGYMEIGECTFANIVSIRSKRANGKRLDSWEESFYRENRSIVDLPVKLTPEEQEFLDSDW